MTGEKLDEVKLLKELADEAGIFLDSKMQERFADYKNLLLETNKKFNLTRITGADEVDLKHFMDSLAVLPFLRKYSPALASGREASLIDVGTGAGFPGLALKIAEDKIKLTLLDSLRKRIDFLKEVTSALGLSGVESLHMRAEDAGKDPDYREAFDISTARAVASLEQLAEYCLPLTKQGGIFLAMKAECRDEIKRAEYAINLLGGKILAVKEYSLPKSDIFRTAVIIKKAGPTPAKYPRKAGRVKADPILKL